MQLLKRFFFGFLSIRRYHFQIKQPLIFLHTSQVNDQPVLKPELARWGKTEVFPADWSAR